MNVRYGDLRIESPWSKIYFPLRNSMIDWYTFPKRLWLRKARNYNVFLVREYLLDSDKVNIKVIAPKLSEIFHFKESKSNCILVNCRTDFLLYQETRVKNKNKTTRYFILNLKGDKTEILKDELNNYIKHLK